MIMAVAERAGEIRATDLRNGTIEEYAENERVCIFVWSEIVSLTLSFRIFATI